MAKEEKWLHKSIFHVSHDPITCGMGKKKVKHFESTSLHITRAIDLQPMEATYLEAWKHREDVSSMT